ncbi:TPA: hypothetical protein LA827_002097 [Clostridium botulinum]|nr:hypothetical protein [Clostridium botulinum]
MKNKNNCTKLEKICLIKIIALLDSIPGNGENIDLSFFEKECKKIEVCTSIA